MLNVIVQGPLEQFELANSIASRSDPAPLSFVFVTVSVGTAIVMLNAWVASGAVPVVAVTAPVKVPPLVGVPLMTPAELKLNPVGKAPAETLNVGEPVDVYVKLYATPSVPDGGPFVIFGATANGPLMKRP